MSKCACGDEMVAELTTVVSDVRGSVLVTRGVPSTVCEMCARRDFDRTTVRSLSVIKDAVRVPGVESVTVDYARIVAHLTETSAPVAADREPDRVGVAGS